MNKINYLKKKNSFLLKKKNIFIFCIVLIIFTIDRVTKILIKNNLDEISFYVNDFINLDLIWNTGIGFGLLNTDSLLLYNFTTIIIGAVIIFLLYLAIISKNLDKLIFAIIIGGAFGNFYDRIFFNAVPDFIDLHYNNFHWFTFNAADIFITIGILFYLIKDFLIRKNNNE
tara:strand:+ start:528 stop:1040 length:513 start_codon:yes stop_codon:yes gene_type:complete